MFLNSTLFLSLVLICSCNRPDRFSKVYQVNDSLELHTDGLMFTDNFTLLSGQDTLKLLPVVKDVSNGTRYEYEINISNDIGLPVDYYLFCDSDSLDLVNRDSIDANCSEIVQNNRTASVAFLSLKGEKFIPGIIEYKVDSTHSILLKFYIHAIPH